MHTKATERWRRALARYERHMFDPDFMIGEPLSRERRLRRRRLMLVLQGRAREVAKLASRLDLDAAAMARFAVELRTAVDSAEACPWHPDEDPEWWDDRVVAEAKVVADLVDFRLPTTEARPDPKEAAHAKLEAERQRLMNTAFARAALHLLADLYLQAPGASRQLAAFNGSGGARWNPQEPAKSRGPGYELARKTLGHLVKCGLVERPKRRSFRMTKDGMTWHRRLQQDGLNAL